MGHSLPRRVLRLAGGHQRGPRVRRLRRQVDQTVQQYIRADLFRPDRSLAVDKYFTRECQILQSARHPNIVQYIGLCLAPILDPVASAVPRTRPRILIVSEYLPRGNLRAYIHSKTLPFPFRLRLSFSIDTARAIAYLHARNCLHRDLKGENLLVTENERLKVCDFGFARIAAKSEEEMRRLSYCGTDGFMVSTDRVAFASL